jgi:hypothetical protein
MPKAVWIITLICLVCVSHPGRALGDFTYRGLIEIQTGYNDAAHTWLDGGFSKTRFDDDSSPVRLGKVSLDAGYHFTDTLWLQSLTDFYLDDGLEAELIEAYFQYRPVPRGPLRWRVKAGAFNPPLSLENTDRGWTSRYSTTPSVINSWVGEDLRTIGAEITLDWPGRFRQSPNSWKVIGAVFGFNDANGTILDHRGWAAHDRQTGLFSPLREPTLVPGVPREIYPFYENDDRPGYYLAGEWGWRDSLTLQFFHYDNLARTGVARGGQSGWRTGFRQIAAQWRLPGQWVLISQFMFGNTRAVNPVYYTVYDSDFQAFYLLVNKMINRHSISARAEYFSIDDLDHELIGFSRETGRSLMLSWQYEYSPQIRFGAEWEMLDSRHEERRIITGGGEELVHQLLFMVQYRFQK